MFEENGVSVNLPFLKPTDTLKYLLQKEPWLFFGGLNPGPEAEELLSTFWRFYRSEHGTHQVYQMAADGKIRLEQTIPLILHGDGGRTQKKQPIEIVSFRPVLGIDTNEACLKCSCHQTATYTGKRKSDPMAPRLNNRNNSYLTHFLIFSYPSKMFKSTPGLFKSILEEASMDLKAACCDGVFVSGGVYHVAILGVSGDMEYHAKTGTLNRSYQNVGHRNFIPCCHECDAGDIRYPFEDVSSSPAWVNTLYQTPPWSQPPPFKHIPFEDWGSGQASRFFKKDPFHIFRLGIARNFIGSTIVLFCSLGLFDDAGDSKDMNQRLIRAWSSFSLWCDTHNVSPGAIRSFSKEKLHMPTKGSFPWCGGKGSDSILLLKWLRVISGLHAAADPSSSVFPLVVKACDGGLSFQAIHRHGIFLKPSCRSSIIRATKDFTQSYARLADYAYKRQMQLYAMVPKLHSMHHFAIHLASCSADQLACNPALYDCSASEDFIGHVSRQSRRISYVKLVENTLLAYLVKTRFVLKRFKKARRI
eukprot:Skav210844  [mRNA]  locus=scaffold543:347409:348998:+ [translate_table: standard]